jgi:hypothetical protein
MKIGPFVVVSLIQESKRGLAEICDKRWRKETRQFAAVAARKREAKPRGF